ncbi:MAG: epoxyqueuosine reductase QueH [Thermovirgaceae bacterium]|nr:epoxyqueuosine reductase QueH [Thermovirgaceae bacterium]
MTYKILLHVCCAPDATVPWPILIDEGHNVAGYFYSSNIHPRSEFSRRADDVRALAKILAKDCIVDAYMPVEWLDKVRGVLLSPEGGPRCAACFRAQMEGAAKAAVSGGFDALSTTLSISPHKDVGVINAVGEQVCRGYGLKWFFRVWRKNGGFALSVQRSAEMGLYRQRYCGCVLSIRKDGTE